MGRRDEWGLVLMARQFYVLSGEETLMETPFLQLLLSSWEELQPGHKMPEMEKTSGPLPRFHPPSRHTTTHSSWTHSLTITCV